MARAREVPGVSPSTPFGETAARVVAVRAEELFAHSEGVLDTDDIERVHDMRVATRRLRAALEVFAKCFPRREHRSCLREVKALADALGERRDRDVAIAELEALAAELGDAERPGIGSLVDELRAEQGRANRELERFVAPEALAGLRTRLDDLVAGAEPRASAPGAAAPAAVPTA